ncbi:hypothetical protein M422DRAFT_262357 [Sphaerobolus stellatus SS14]|uniref:Uncharacterized protein n=1 Tax=Sphaerobolus stellatus (strain SS14) TaxID=990650 RepID=A0A0C9VD00_SPHS4|nr:hypothetical protein M422DRAFT_262357 [Sphaerobolus stellatus SS14]
MPTDILAITVNGIDPSTEQPYTRDEPPPHGTADGGHETYTHFPFSVDGDIPAYSPYDGEETNSFYQIFGDQSQLTQYINEYNAQDVQSITYSTLWELYKYFGAFDFDPNRIEVKNELKKWVYKCYKLGLSTRYVRNPRDAGVCAKLPTYRMDYLFALAAYAGMLPILPPALPEAHSFKLQLYRLGTFLKDKYAILEIELHERYTFIGTGNNHDIYLVFRLVPGRELPCDERRHAHPEWFEPIGTQAPAPLPKKYRPAFLILMAYILWDHVTSFSILQENLPGRDGDAEAYTAEQVPLYTDILEHRNYDIYSGDLKKIDDNMPVRYKAFGEHYYQLFGDGFFLENLPVVMHSRYGPNWQFTPTGCGSEVSSDNSRLFFAQISLLFEGMAVVNMAVAVTYSFEWYDSVNALPREQWKFKDNQCYGFNRPVYEHTPSQWAQVYRQNSSFSVDEDDSDEFQVPPQPPMSEEALERATSNVVPNQPPTPPPESNSDSEAEQDYAPPRRPHMQAGITPTVYPLAYQGKYGNAQVPAIPTYLQRTLAEVTKNLKPGKAQGGPWL